MTGYRGCGKSTVGALVANSLGFEYVDTDAVVESSAGESIAELFEHVGEAGFRDLESDAIRNVGILTQPAVISLGGGAILREENRALIREMGVTVWLQASPETLMERISKDSSTATRRPKLSKLGDLEEIRSILSQRACWYQAIADMHISTELHSLEQVATQIVNWYRENS
ncbi:MAG: shikimate kinase [Pirellula sp.]